MESLFQKFDFDGSNKLTSTTLKQAFTKVGHFMTSEEVEQVMNEHDVDHDHELTFEEFRALIMDEIWLDF